MDHIAASLAGSGPKIPLGLAARASACYPLLYNIMSFIIYRKGANYWRKHLPDYIRINPVEHYFVASAAD